jgi:DNA-binding MarR family transcriptional regulator
VDPHDPLVDAARALATGARLLERALDDMTLTQFRVLTVVATSPERASKIAERAAVSRPSLSGVLDGLVSRGWVTRSLVDGDRRGVRLDLTPAGRKALTAACHAAAEAVAAVLHDVPSEERSTALRGLELLAHAFDQRGARRANAQASLR